MKNLAVFYDHIPKAQKQLHDAGTELTLPQMLERCRDWGYSAVEIGSDTLAESGSSVLPMLAEAGFGISGMYHVHDFIKDTGGPDSAVIDEIRRTVELACTAGTRNILVVAGFFSGEDAREINARHSSYAETAAWMEQNPAANRVRDGLAAFCREAASCGIRTGIEDYGEWTSPTAMIYEDLWLLKHVPGLCYTFDTGNYAYNGEGVLEAYEVLHPYITHIHMKDHTVNRDAPDTDPRKYTMGCAAGDGYVPLRTVAEREKTRGYSGFYVVEHDGVKDQPEALRRSAEYMKSIL